MAKTWTKEITVEDNTFRIIFWNDRWDFPWTRIEKKVWVRPWYSKKYRVAWETVCEYWTTDDRIDMADQEITEYLVRQKEQKEFEKRLDNWCK